MKDIKKVICITFTIILLIFTFSFAGCKDTRLKPIEYDENLVYDIMVWDAPINTRKTQEGFNEIAEAGYNIILPALYTMDFASGVENAVEFLDKAWAAGLKVYVIDSDFCVYISHWNPEGNVFKETDKSNVDYYKDHPAFIGLNISDEPVYSHFELLEYKVADFKETFPDKSVFINLWPRGAGSGNYGTDYSKYLDDFMKNVQPSLLSYDHYPFDTQLGFWSDWFTSLEEIKYKAMEYNTPANMIMQVDGSEHYSKRHCTEEEIRWQMAVIMAFGYESITHYTYASIDETNFGVIKNGQKTQLYYDIQTANLEIRQWDHVYESFVHGYQGTAVVRGSHGILDTKLEFFSNDISLNDIPEIKSVDSSEYLLMGSFKDSNNNNGFMVTNATIPEYEKAAAVTMEFDRKYRAVQLYEKGVMSVVRLDNNELTLEIQSGEGVFIIPLR